MTIGTFCSSPVPCIHNLAGIPPLDIRSLKLTFNYELKKCRTLATQNLKPFFFLPKPLLENNLNIANIILSTCYLTPPWENHISTYIESTLNKKNLTFSSIYKMQYLHAIHDIFSEKVFTDASKSSNRVNTAIICNQSGNKLQTSNFLFNTHRRIYSYPQSPRDD